MTTATLLAALEEIEALLAISPMRGMGAHAIARLAIREHAEGGEPEAVAGRSFWVIEHRRTTPTSWWRGCPSHEPHDPEQFGWTKNIDSAIKFVSAADAERGLKAFGFFDSLHFVTEHSYLGNAAPPSAPEPVATLLAEIDAVLTLHCGKCGSTDLHTAELDGDETVSCGECDHIWPYDRIEEAQKAGELLQRVRSALAAPLPSAGRPVTPCTREDAVEIAKRAEVITPDIENAAVQGSKHFWVAGVIELMRLIDAARGVS